MRLIPTALAITVCCLASSCETADSARSGTAQQPPPSTFVHSFTKFSFPESVGSFHRLKVQKYDPQGRDIGVGYDSSTPIALTVFVYPGPKDFALLPSPKLGDVSEGLLDGHFQTCKKDIIRHHSDARLITEGACEIVQGGNRFKGRKAVYSLNYTFGPLAKPQLSLSELYVFLVEPGLKFLATDRNFNKYRITYPETKKVQTETEVSEFMNNLLWPVK